MAKKTTKKTNGVQKAKEESFESHLRMMSDSIKPLRKVIADTRKISEDHLCRKVTI